MYRKYQKEGGVLKKDTVTKDFISDNSVFADIFNYYIYGGEQVIKPGELVERDPTEIAVPYGSDGAAVPVQKFRDVQKLCSARTDGKLCYVLYGAEAQSEIHYAMAVKNNLYDALDYAGQVEEAAKSHKRDMKNKDSSKKKKPSPAEFLSGFWKEDRLVPSVTVTVYFGCGKWDGPLSLFDMMDIKDKRVLACLDNYHVHLVAPSQMPDSEIMKFQTGMREVMLFIKYSKDREKLLGILEDNKTRFQELCRRAADVIEAVTNTGIKYNEEAEVVDMCKAIQELREEERQIGEKAGREIGEKTGELKKAQEASRNFYNMGLPVEKIAQGIGYSVETVEEWLGISVNS